MFVNVPLGSNGDTHQNNGDLQIHPLFIKKHLKNGYVLWKYRIHDVAIKYDKFISTHSLLIELFYP